MLASVLLYEPGAVTVLQRLLLPLLFGVGAALVLRNVLAVAATGAVLAALHADLAGDWISAAAYPLIGTACAAVAAVILGRRYRNYVRATRADRAAARAARQERSGP
ncbi:MAG: hypothetical protein AAGI15_02865 [Pseudomonadota bacterium]